MNILSHEYLSLEKELCNLNNNTEPNSCPHIFNLSSVPIFGTENYIGCARIMIKNNSVTNNKINNNINSYDDDIIIPGQDIKCSYQMIMNTNKSIGNNFFGIIGGMENLKMKNILSFIIKKMIYCFIIYLMI